MRDQQDTPTSCPLCGHSDVPSPGCILCHGAKVVPREVGERWKRRTAARATTTTHAATFSIQAQIQKLRSRKGAENLIAVGEALIDEIVSWARNPLPAEADARTRFYREQVNPWIEETERFLK